MPLILGTNSIKDTGYNVANSVRLEAAYMKRTVTPSTSNTWTLSFWLKKSGHNGSSEGYLFSYGSDGGQGLYISAAGYIGYYGASGYTSDSTLSSGVLKDSSAWYHILFSVSSGTGTLYINGVQDAQISNVAPLNATTGNTYAVNSYINYEANFDNFLGYLTEYVFIDGTAYNQNSFGEFDEDSPTIWKPIDVSGLTFGTNGFYLDFEDSSDLGKDVSGNGNDFTTTGLAATDQSTDTCTNNFATFNPLITFPANPPVLSEGNLKVETVDQDPAHFGGASTIGVSQGKWYFESTSLSSRELVTAGGGSITHAVGIHSNPAEAARLATTYSAQVTGGVWYATNGKYYSTATGTSGASYGSSFAHDDIIGVAIDLDNHKAYFHKNGTYQNSGDPTSGSTGTGAISIPTGLTYFAFVTDVGGSANTSSINFGSPINSISSGNSDANGFGNFEYAVPSGYFSLCTKNLAENG
tara:strand:- start:1431 stop:2834 length:1404 start_codon:yes stop_codon:yes gene_type:complete